MILLVSGEENFLSFRKLKQIKEKFSSKSLENPNIEELDEKTFNFSELIKLASATPFLSQKRLIILKNVLASKVGEDEEEKIIEYLPKIPESTFVLFYEETDSFVNKKLIKKVISLAQKTWNFKKFRNFELEKWAEKEILKRKSRISKSALPKLISFVGNNLWQLNQEIEKLTAYKNGKIIEEDDVDQLVSVNLNNNVFELIDNIGEKNLKKTLNFLNNLIEQGEEIMYLLRMIVYQVRNLILIKELALKNLTKSEIIKKTGKHPFVVTKSLAQVRNFSSEELEELYNRIFETELKIKTGKIEPKTALNLLATKLCLKQ